MTAAEKGLVVAVAVATSAALTVIWLVGCLPIDNSPAARLLRRLR